MSIESSRASRGGGKRLLILACVLAFLPVACGGETSGGAQGESDGKAREEAAAGTPASGETTILPDETTVANAPSGEAAELAKAKPSPQEIQNMLPADGKKPDPAKPLPEDPPEGIEVYPATTNETTKEPIEYDRSPPTNGRHDPLWQNCGVYEEPIKDRHAVHSLDHGVVWITHQPDLPANQTDKLRSYGTEDNVIVSPYPGQEAPVTVTSWRVQLELEDAEDPRLRQFVDDFRNSEIAPLSGNRCTLGVG